MIILDTPDLVLLAVLMIILAIVIYFELRFMRSRNKEYIDRTMDRDDTFNSIATTKAIAQSLKQKGRDTREAEHAIIQAEQAYKRGNFLASREFSKKARDILIAAPTVELVTPEAKEDQPEPEDKEHMTVHEVRKMEPNMMESKFIISSCRDRLKAEDGSGRDLCRAEEHLAKAEECFDRKDYNDALKEGLIARRMIGDDSIEVLPEVRKKDGQEQEMKCAECGTAITSDDMFCRKCGVRLSGDGK